MLDSKGMFPKDGEDRPELPDYLIKSFKGVIFGSFSDESTLLSIALNIISGWFGSDFPADLRDIAADVIKLIEFGSKKETWLDLLLNTIAFLPVIGSIKYIDEAVDIANPVVKNYDEAAEIAKKALKNSDEAANTGKAVVKGSDEAGNIGKAIIKNGDEAADIGKAVVKESLESSLKNIDDFIDGNKSFEDVLDDYAKIYADKVNSNVRWSWDKSIKGAEKLKGKHKLIKQYAVDHAYIPNIKVTKVPVSYTHLTLPTIYSV